jgi:hypothetical protein
VRQLAERQEASRCLSTEKAKAGPQVTKDQDLTADRAAGAFRHALPPRSDVMKWAGRCATGAQALDAAVCVLSPVELGGELLFRPRLVGAVGRARGHDVTRAYSRMSTLGLPHSFQGLTAAVIFLMWHLGQQVAQGR